MTSYELTHFKKMVRVWKTKSLLFCLRYDPLIVFRRQNHIIFIFIKNDVTWPLRANGLFRAARRQSLCLLLEKGENRKSQALKIIVECEAVVSKHSSAISRADGSKLKMCLLPLLEKGETEKTKLSLSSTKEKLSPQRFLAVRNKG